MLSLKKDYDELDKVVLIDLIKKIEQFKPQPFVSYSNSRMFQ